jgi:hypothetical protein
LTKDVDMTKDGKTMKGINLSSMLTSWLQ